MTTTFKVVRLLGGLGLAAILAMATGQMLLAQGPHVAARAKLLESHACDGCDLSGDSFHAADLKGVSLAHANLTGAVFYKADLTNANLAGADLTKAALPYANLTNANLAGANLTGANLSNAIAADLTSAVTTETTTCPNGQAGPCR